MFYYESSWKYISFTCIWKLWKYSTSLFETTCRSILNIICISWANWLMQLLSGSLTLQKMNANFYQNASARPKNRMENKYFFDFYWREMFWSLLQAVQNSDIAIYSWVLYLSSIPKLPWIFYWFLISDSNFLGFQ